VQPPDVPGVEVGFGEVVVNGRGHGQRAGDAVARRVALAGPRVDLRLPVFLACSRYRRLGRQRAAPVFVAGEDADGVPGGRVALDGVEGACESADIHRLGRHDLHVDGGHGGAEDVDPCGQLRGRVGGRAVDTAAIRLVSR